MLIKYKKTALTIALLISAASSAEFSPEREEILFTANRIGAVSDQLGSSSLLITEAEIKQRQYQTVTEAIAAQPGITLSQNGLNGPSSLFIRGSKSEHTLVLVDGVPVGDAMGAGRSVDFANFGRLLNIDRIEVLKGPQSTLYGSSAMGGVIQLFTKKGGTPQTNLHFGGDTNNTFTTSAATSGTVNQFRYSLAGLMERSKGIDATEDYPGKLDKNRDKDRYKNRQLSGSVNILLTDELDLDLAFLYNNRRADYDNNWNATPYRDENHSKQFTGRVALNGEFFEDQLSTSLAYTLSDLRRENHSGNALFDWATGDFLGHEKTLNEFKSRGQTVGLYNTLRLHKDFETAFGVSYSHEHGEGNNEKHSQNTKSIYLDQSFNFNDRFFNTLGIRYDKNSEFGGKVTYRATSRYNFTNFFALKGSVGTGFNAPNIYQLYDGFVGNRELKAETNVGFDLGMVYQPTSDSQIELTYFYNRYKEMIDYFDLGNWQGEYRNLDRAKMQGIELAGDIRFNDELQLSAHYTYLSAKERAPGGSYKRMLRRPKHTLGASLNYAPMENLNLNLSGTYYSKRKDLGDQDLKAFALFDVAASYKINRNFAVDLKVKNLFDKKYNFADGYREQGATGYLGVNVSL